LNAHPLARQSSHQPRVRRNRPAPSGVVPPETTLEVPMKGIIAWLLGVPLFVIILLYVFNFF
jgi:hypothetical protein